MKQGWKTQRLGDLGVAAREVAGIVPDAEYELWSVPSFASNEPELAAAADIGSAKLRVRPNDVLICKINPRINRVWLVRHPTNGRAQIASPEWLVFRINQGAELLPSWLIHFVSAPKFREWIESEVSGATGSHTRAKADGILQQQIPVPTLPEQQRIVGILDEAFEGIANAKTNAEQNLQKVRALFESHLQSVFTQRDDGWEPCTIGDQLMLQRGFDITKGDQNEGSVPVVSSGGIKSFHDKAMVQSPGVVIGRKGTLGKVFYLGVDFWPHDTTLWVKDFKGNVPRFVFYFFTGLDVKQLDSGAANPALNRNQVHPIKISWPPVSRQQEIVDTLDALSEETKRLESIYQQKLAALDALKKSLLHEAFAGGL